MKYVVGFAIDIILEEVLLIKKLKPDWQKGFLNGVGGKCKDGEQAHNAITREFREEIGMCITNWRKFCVTKARDGEVHFFVAKVDKVDVGWPEDEQPVWVSYRPLPFMVIDNLNWLIPMAIAKVPVMAKVKE